MEYNTEYKDRKWEMKTKIENITFNSFDFSGTLFNYPIFENVQFEDCLFNRSDITDARIYGSSFINCRFIKID